MGLGRRFFQKVARFILPVALGFLLTACGQDGFDIKGSSGVPAGDNGGLGQKQPDPPVPTPPVTPPTTPPPGTGADQYKAEAAPLWEAARPKDGKQWTIFAFGVVEQYGDALLRGTSDMKSFCPSYFSMTANERVNFWVYLVSAVVKYESGFSPISRYQETTMGTDPITHQPVWSEGLLQLSYQDVSSYPFCAEDLDWAHDKNLSVKDPGKTILDPYKNLMCGIRIMNQQVKNKDLIAVRGYWSTLFPSGASSKASPIRALTTQLKFCQ